MKQRSPKLFGFEGRPVIPTFSVQVVKKARKGTQFGPRRVAPQKGKNDSLHRKA